MLTINYSSLINHLEEYLDKVCEDNETVIVTGKDEKNVVIISLEAYNNMMENLFIMSNQKNYKRLLESRRQIEHGKTVD
ncbi:type II toxin-antitoxin system Phd/YefM family antitoxin [Acidaminobacter sp.]|uniref:type II toxin-antitoxin system Phd/YefM family antitoxin n=1 Tax=Acidaminobacter sp. TaxID=1872102 RepID=UPI002569E1C1|nr:type II toxin-antitoxin system Phd/YefM family antitoxin [Acidaminobacter sp.]MDK9712232.1 type II toxin-antitoxin system Phd/YefM family antitoxin [Acidaminobacter sp.]